MSWLDDFYNQFTKQEAPSPSVSEPRALGRYGFDPGAEAAMQGLVNQFAPIFGHQTIVVDGQLTAGNAAAIVSIQRKLFEQYACDTSTQRTGLAKLEVELDQAAKFAKDEKSITITPDQMWCSINQNGILAKLPVILGAITSGQLKKCGSLPWWGWAGIGFGALVLLGRKTR